MSATEFLRIITVALGGNHPMRFVFGLALGVFVKMAVSALAASYPDVKAWAAIDSFAIGWFMGAMAPVPFVPLIFAFGGANESVAHQIRTVEALLDAEKATEAQRALVWRSLTRKYLETVQPNLSKGPSVMELFEKTKAEAAADKEKPVKSTS